MILVMELIILAIFQAQGIVLIPASLCPTSLPIRLLQSSQNGDDRRHLCVESTIERCKDTPRADEMATCVRFYFINCMDPVAVRKGGFSRKHYNFNASIFSAICKGVCFKGDRESVAHPHHAICLAYCLEMFI
jgi:hypothetical protein